VLLVSHGTVDHPDDLEAFVTRVRRGRPPSPELVRELRRRYEAIGGRSTLNLTSAALAGKLEARLGVPVAWAGRLAPPFVRDAFQRVVDRGATRVAVVPLAQHSAAVYAAGAREAARGLPLDLVCAENWGREPGLTEAFARRIEAVLPGRGLAAETTLLFTAHSLPIAVLAAGDPYETEVRASANAVLARLGDEASHLAHEVAFQSQGLAGSGPDSGTWLGPDLPTALDAAKARGSVRVVFAPIGFLADHVEVLYDLDIEARALARARRLDYVRAASLNASDDLVDVLASVASKLLGSDASPRPRSAHHGAPLLRSAGEGSGQDRKDGGGGR
jgi:ferrochelatase